MLRIWEIAEVFQKNEIEGVSDHVDHILRDDLRVTLVRPVVEDKEFGEIRGLLEASISNYLRDPWIKEKPSAQTVTEVVKRIEGIVEARKCNHCDHHELGIKTEAGEFFPLHPGMRIKVSEE